MWLALSGRTAAVIYGATSVVALALYLLDLPSRAPHLVFSTPATRTVIADPTKFDALSIQFENQPVNTPVTALQVYVWNSGRGTIRRESLLEPLRLRLSPEARILQASVSLVSRPVTDF